MYIVSILGINSIFHDSSSSLITQDSIYSSEEERFTGIKHAKKASYYNSWMLPYNAINACLKDTNLKLKDIDYIGYSFDPDSLKIDKKNEKYTKEWFLYSLTKKIPDLIINESPLQKDILKRLTVINSNWKFYFIEHHLTHAASSFFVSTFENAAILSIDGIGEKTCTLMASGQNNKIKKIKEILYPNSLGYFYEEITKFLGFQRNNDEYKIMALASYGKPKYYNELRKLIVLKPEGEYQVNINFKKPNILGLREFRDIFGNPRLWDAELTERHLDIACSAQKILEDTVLHILNWLYKKTKTKNLCLAGGVALNCVLNERISNDSSFENIFIQPAANDAGTSLGAALWIKHEILNHPREFAMEHAYLGPEFDDSEIKNKLITAKIKFKKSKNICNETARFISEGKIIGWFQGRMEFGPRALGNRSILADPRIPEMKDIVNKIKGRENFRPLAPSILEEFTQEYFENDEPSPFMLFARKVKSDKTDKIPAVVHVDGTARLQTVNKKQNPLFYQLIQEFYKISGIPIVLNTSFNYKGKPIVCNIEQAIDCFFNSGLDILILGNYIIFK